MNTYADGITSVPVVYTTRGNVPVADLEMQVTWEDVPGEYTKCIETYRMDGEIVRQSCHVLHRHGMAVEAMGGIN